MTPSDYKLSIKTQKPFVILKESSIRDRSFFMREEGAGGIWGGHSKKIGLKGGAAEKNEGKGGGGSDEKIRLKIG